MEKLEIKRLVRTVPLRRFKVSFCLVGSFNEDSILCLNAETTPFYTVAISNFFLFSLNRGTVSH